MNQRALSKKRLVSRKAQSGRAEMAVDAVPARETRRAHPAHDVVLQDPPERQLREALNQIDELLKHNAQLKVHVASLAGEVAKARAFSYHDELTGLPNRRLFQDRFGQAAGHAQRQGRRLALLFIDLDGFKHVNDRLGHLAGDRILKMAAARLKECVREGETACRFGGDEFLVLLTNLKDRKSISPTAL